MYLQITRRMLDLLTSPSQMVNDEPPEASEIYFEYNM